MPPRIDDENDHKSLLALYNITQSEITRYRDREWKNAVLFTTAIAAILGFILTKNDIAKNYCYHFDISLIGLVIGNIYYSLYAHTRLTEQRNVKKRIEYLLGFDELKIGENGKSVLFYEISEPKDDDFCKCWKKGVISHLIPFFVVSAILAIFGILLLFCQW